jgi:hypothetical protein
MKNFFVFFSAQFYRKRQNSNLLFYKGVFGTKKAKKQGAESLRIQQNQEKAIKKQKKRLNS